MNGPLVTVVIPAYNAEATIDETLRSVRAQTYQNMEIIVVDDGSTDGTLDIVRRHAVTDRRILIISQPNLGVAAARNRAIEQSRSDFVAPIDADDLWHPSKIEKQVTTMLARGPRVGLVYTWQARIDEQSRVISATPMSEEEGDVFTHMLRRNLVGNGSSPLMRKDAIMEMGGYDPSLRQRGGEGCEDRKLYAAIAEKYEFAVIKEYLTGYRRTTRSMSSNTRVMVRSHNLVVATWRRKYPHRAAEIAEGVAMQRRWLFTRALRHRDLPTAFMVLLMLICTQPSTLAPLFQRVPRLVRHRVVGVHTPGLANEPERELFLPTLPDTALDGRLLPRKLRMGSARRAHRGKQPPRS